MNRPDLCLEFVNTRFWRGQAEPTETLKAAAARGQLATVELNRRILVPRTEIVRLSGGALK